MVTRMNQTENNLEKKEGAETEKLESRQGK